MHMVILRVRMEALSNGTTVHVRVESVFRSAIPAVLVVAGIFGGVMASAAVISEPRPLDLVLSLLVPLLSGIFTMLVIVVPAMAWMAFRYGGRQRRWLLSYVEGLFSGDGLEVQPLPDSETQWRRGR